MLTHETCNIWQYLKHTQLWALPVSSGQGHPMYDSESAGSFLRQAPEQFALCRASLAGTDRLLMAFKAAQHQPGDQCCPAIAQAMLDRGPRLDSQVRPVPTAHWVSLSCTR